MSEEYRTGKVFAMYSDGHAVKVGTTSDDAQWYDVADDIQKFVNKDYKDANVRYKERQKGKRREIFVLFKQDKVSEEKKPVDTKLVCPDCGKAKAEKYEKCWVCNKKNPAKKTNKDERSNEYWDKKDELMSRQWAIRTAAMAIQKLEGGVADLETLEQQIIALSDKFYNKAHGII